MSAREPAIDAAGNPAVSPPVGGRRGLATEDVTALTLFALTALLIFVSQWLALGLGSWDQARAILVLSTFVMVVGFGQQMVILTGGLDLSVGPVMTLGAVLMFSYVGDTPMALLWGLPLVMLLTGAVGVLNGIGVALLRVPPFIMTLAMGIILGSALLGLTGGAPAGTVPPALTRLFNDEWFGAPPVIFLMMLFTVLATLFQRRTAFGRMVYAIGTSPAAAHIAGLPVRRVTLLCYAISAAASGCAGVLMVGFSHGATLNSGDDILVPSIAAVVVGGTSIFGGRGTYLGVVGGALLLTTFSTMITALGLAAGWRAVIYGSVILLALLTLQHDLKPRRRWLNAALDRARVGRAPPTSDAERGTPQ